MINEEKKIKLGEKVLKLEKEIQELETLKPDYYELAIINLYETLAKIRYEIVSIEISELPLEEREIQKIIANDEYSKAKALKKERAYRWALNRAEDAVPNQFINNVPEQTKKEIKEALQKIGVPISIETNNFKTMLAEKRSEQTKLYSEYNNDILYNQQFHRYQKRYTR